MALQLISIDSVPAYLALSSDMSNGVITGATLIGKTVVLTDTGDWRLIINGSGSTIDYKLPESFPMP